jgi:hypothetical protein
MTLSFPNDLGQEVTVYTDGLCFCNEPPEKLCEAGLDNIVQELSSSIVTFTLKEGIYKLSFDFRLSVYNSTELHDPFRCINKLFINTKIYKDIYILLEPEITIEPLMKHMPKETYYDITFLTEEKVKEILTKDITIMNNGNLLYWKSRLEMIDYIFKP